MDCSVCRGRSIEKYNECMCKVCSHNDQCMCEPWYKGKNGSIQEGSKEGSIQEGVFKGYNLISRCDFYKVDWVKELKYGK